MYDCIELNNEMYYLDKDISDMAKATNINELWSIYQIAQKRLERIYRGNHERLMLIDSIIQEPKNYR